MMIRRLHTLTTSLQDLGCFQVQAWLPGMGLGHQGSASSQGLDVSESNLQTQQPVDLLVVVVAYHYHDSQSLRDFTSIILAKISRSRHLLSSSFCLLRFYMVFVCFQFFLCM